MNTINEWFSSGGWAEGLTVAVHNSVDVGEFYKQYHAKPGLWRAVFEFMKQDLFELEVGKYQLIEEEAFVMISEYDTKEPENAKWEAHKKFIDLQYVIAGEEQMGILPLVQAVNSLEYNEQKDVIFYGDNSGQLHLATPEAFFLFFPSDVHRPCIKVGESAPVKKLVAKIAVAG
ncbi:MAG: YhcH/YjgK/YiaL family protein [Mangrovibacterium sp.]